MKTTFNNQSFITLNSNTRKENLFIYFVFYSEGFNLKEVEIYCNMESVTSKRFNSKRALSFGKFKVCITL